MECAWKRSGYRLSGTPTVRAVVKTLKKLNSAKCKKLAVTKRTRYLNAVSENRPLQRRSFP